jgi:hypothetical protein
MVRDRRQQVVVHQSISNGAEHLALTRLASRVGLRVHARCDRIHDPDELGRPAIPVVVT